MLVPLVTSWRGHRNLDLGTVGLLAAIPTFIAAPLPVLRNGGTVHGRASINSIGIGFRAFRDTEKRYAAGAESSQQVGVSSMAKILFVLGLCLAPATLLLLWTTNLGPLVFESFRLPGARGWTIEYVPVPIAAVIAESIAYVEFRRSSAMRPFILCTVVNVFFFLFHIFVIWYLWGEQR